MNEKRRELINHLKRIEGQIKRLEQYVREEKNWDKIGHLAISTAKSFDAFHAASLETFLIEEIEEATKVNHPSEDVHAILEHHTERIHHVLRLYKQ